ncbi:hypothetical protein OPU39_12600, partial [Acinetobacter nosocomialis]|nr:hypothetical protein [Acinetobacter nosocomialis]
KRTILCTCTPKRAGGYLSVGHVWMLWLITIVLSFALYPAVKWFSKFKHQNKHISILKYF